MADGVEVNSCLYTNLSAADYCKVFSKRHVVAQGFLAGIDIAAVEARYALRAHNVAAGSTY